MIRFSRMRMRKVFVLIFSLFVILPVLIALIISIAVTLDNVRDNAVENIRLFHESIVAMLEAEERNASSRLSHLMFVDNNRIPSLAVEADVDDNVRKYDVTQELNALLDYTLPPVSEILSVRFVYESGRYIEYKSELNLDIPQAVIKEAMADQDNVHLMAINAGEYPSMYAGTTNDNLIWLAVISPSLMLDRSEGISYVALLQISSVYRAILSYDVSYSLGRNNIGYTAVVDKDSHSILSSSRIDRDMVHHYFNGESVAGITFISTPVNILSSHDYEILTAVRTSDLLSGYGVILVILILAVIVLLISMLIFMYLLLRNVINPVSEVSKGLRAVENGNLEQHIDPQGPKEVREVIHSFNAMVRRIRAMVSDYEEEISIAGSRPEALMKGFVDSTLSHKEEIHFARKYLSSDYRLILLHLDRRLDEESFRRNMDSILQFSASALAVSVDEKDIIIHFRRDNDSMQTAYDLVSEIFRCCENILKLTAVATVSPILDNPESGRRQLEMLESSIPMLPLLSESRHYEADVISDLASSVIPASERYHILSAALISADEKNLNDEREKLSARLASMSLEDAGNEVIAVILALSRRLESGGMSLHDLFGYSQDYPAAVKELTDLNSLMLFISNLLTQAEDEILKELDLDTLDPIARAKRYIADNYQNQNLSLSDVASYVGLNEKYFTTCFTKAAGETFMSYLTGIRIQNAKLLLRKTTFKVYEVAAMCGYTNAEHFIRTFRKVAGCSPIEWRKMTNTQ